MPLRNHTTYSDLLLKPFLQAQPVQHLGVSQLTASLLRHVIVAEPIKPQRQAAARVVNTGVSHTARRSTLFKHTPVIQLVNCASGIFERNSLGRGRLVCECQHVYRAQCKTLTANPARTFLGAKLQRYTDLKQLSTCSVAVAVTCPASLSSSAAVSDAITAVE